MRNRYSFVVVLALFLVVTVCHAETTRRRIPDFHVINELPENMVAGATYETSFTFVKPKRPRMANLTVTIEITEAQSAVGFQEFWVEGEMQTWQLSHSQHSNMVFTEVSGGVFQSQTLMEGVSFNYVKLKVSSAPSLKPGCYMFLVNVTLRC